jgi:hypothetical protein
MGPEQRVVGIETLQAGLTALADELQLTHFLLPSRDEQCGFTCHMHCTLPVDTWRERERERERERDSTDQKG